MMWFRRRRHGPSPEALAAIEAADRSHKMAVDTLHGVVSLDPEVRAQQRLLEAHNEANHWQEWLFGTILSSHRRPA